MASEFDAVAESYDADLHRGLALSGETKDYFAERRVQWLKARVDALALDIKTILDFGCGDGSTSPLLQRAFDSDVIGIDPSRGLIQRARQDYESSRIRFFTVDEGLPDCQVDLAYVNGVFHHVEESSRLAQAMFIRRALRDGGVLGFWENNPWNPGTRMVMRRIPFDRDAKMLAAPVARRLLASAGFRVARTDFLFVFPAFLKGLRVLEAGLARFPIGAQYEVLGIAEPAS